MQNKDFITFYVHFLFKHTVNYDYQQFIIEQIIISQSNTDLS